MFVQISFGHALSNKNMFQYLKKRKGTNDFY